MMDILGLVDKYLWVLAAIGICVYIGYFIGYKAYAKKSMYVADPVPEGGWRCPNCGKPHPVYEYMCSCCTRKEEAEAIIAKKAEEQAANDSAIAETRKYKQLLDEGILTQEEFEAKKKQLLGL